eukprot:5763369-Pleurochrysis_carterae.AAC.1
MLHKHYSHVREVDHLMHNGQEGWMYILAYEAWYDVDNDMKHLSFAVGVCRRGEHVHQLHSCSGKQQPSQLLVLTYGKIAVELEAKCCGD